METRRVEFQERFGGRPSPHSRSPLILRSAGPRAVPHSFAGPHLVVGQSRDTNILSPVSGKSFAVTVSVLNHFHLTKFPLEDSENIVSLIYSSSPSFPFSFRDPYVLRFRRRHNTSPIRP